MKGTNIAEQFHVVNLYPPVSVSTGATETEIFFMGNYGHASIIVQFGATDSDAGNLTIEECDDFSGSNDTAISFDYWAETTALGDTLAAKVNAASINVSANDNIFYVIEIDASQLTADYPYLQLKWSSPGGATVISAVAILSGSRYAEESSATAII